MNNDAMERAKARLAVMHEEAKRITEAAGLPKETIYTVVSIIYKYKKNAAGEVTEDTVLAHVRELAQQARNLTEALGFENVVDALNVLQDRH